jgi:hypothetical protein
VIGKHKRRERAQERVVREEKELRLCYSSCSGTPCTNRHFPFNTNNCFSYIFPVLNECTCVFNLCCRCMLDICRELFDFQA